MDDRAVMLSRLLDAYRRWRVLCHYRHKLAGLPIISWPKLSGLVDAVC
jgi:hypothetical protein